MCRFFLLWLGKKMNIFSVRGKNSEAENLHKAGKLQMLKQKQTNKKRITSLPKEKKNKKNFNTHNTSLSYEGREDHYFSCMRQEDSDRVIMKLTTTDCRSRKTFSGRKVTKKEDKKQHLRNFNKCAGLMTHYYTQVVECWGEFTLAVRIKGLPRVSLQGLGVFW